MFVAESISREMNSAESPTMVSIFNMIGVSVHPGRVDDFVVAKMGRKWRPFFNDEASSMREILNPERKQNSSKGFTVHKLSVLRQRHDYSTQKAGGCSVPFWVELLQLTQPTSTHHAA
jgi:hypothetical protein